MTFTKVESFAKISFKECVNEEDGSRFNHEIIPNKTVCLNETGALWVNPRITFDNVPLAYLALFQIATFKVHRVGIMKLVANRCSLGVD